MSERTFDPISDNEWAGSPQRQIQFLEDVCSPDRVVRLVDSEDLPDLVPDLPPGLVPEEEVEVEDEVDIYGDLHL